ncbi:hypothetical protein PV338_32070, partial [Streptomyces scabiei]|nr:hypothetical protein [Streptomyces scabiei]
MKMLINVAESVVADALRGMAAAHPELTVDVENRVVGRAEAPVAGGGGMVTSVGVAAGVDRESTVMPAPVAPLTLAMIRPRRVPRVDTAV